MSMSENQKLLDLEIRVAKRADQIARQQMITTSLNRHCWLMAEAEVLRDYHSTEPRIMLPAPNTVVLSTCA